MPQKTSQALLRDCADMLAHCHRVDLQPGFAPLDLDLTRIDVVFVGAICQGHDDSNSSRVENGISANDNDGSASSLFRAERGIEEGPEDVSPAHA